MESSAGKKALISGASIAGLSTAYWLNKVGYSVTVVEFADQPRKGGAAINVQEDALVIAKQMGIYEQLKAYRLKLEAWEFKDTDDTTTGSMPLSNQHDSASDDEIKEVEIERDILCSILLGAIKHKVEFIFNNSIAALSELEDAIHVTFKDNSRRTFDLVFGCDGLHSGVRRLWFGHESEYAHFLNYYFSLTIVDKLLIAQGTAQVYNVPGKMIMLNAYNKNTDIAFGFFSEEEIPYDYRDTEQQREITINKFASQGWRTSELLEEVKHAKISYFDKFCQIKMPSWNKGRVALVGDAAYCASPAAGIGASLAIIGAEAVATALEKHQGNFEMAFREYNQKLRPFIEEVQANALVMLSEFLIPKTEEGIRKRNAQEILFE
jgi:2-polyprenyl-6-methoxyphenol hydroxylase-like FAD-dependent oxidoreductase